MIYLIHVEEVWKEHVWSNLLRFIKEKKQKCHLFLMPPQIELQRSCNSYAGTEKELEDILKEKYKILKSIQPKYKFRVGVHIHFSLYPKDMSEKQKKELFIKSHDFIKDIFKNVDGIVFGWYKYDDYIERLCRQYNLKITHWAPFCVNLHDYNLPVSNFSIFERMTKDFLRNVKYKGKIGKNVAGG